MPKLPHYKSHCLTFLFLNQNFGFISSKNVNKQTERILLLLFITFIPTKQYVIMCQSENNINKPLLLNVFQIN